MSANQSQLAALHLANRQAAYLTASLQRAIYPFFFFFFCQGFFAFFFSEWKFDSWFNSCCQSKLTQGGKSSPVLSILRVLHSVRVAAGIIVLMWSKSFSHAGFCASGSF